MSTSKVDLIKRVLAWIILAPFISGMLVVAWFVLWPLIIIVGGLLLLMWALDRVKL